MVLLQAEVPLVGGSLEVEGGRPNLLRRRRTLRMEKLFAFVRPSKGIVDAVVLGEAELVDQRQWGTILAVGRR